MANPITDWLGDSAGESFDGVVRRFAEDSWSFLKGAFEGSNLSPQWWAGVVGAGDDPGMLRVLLVAMLPLLVALVAIQVASGVLQGRSEKILRGAAMAFAGVPLTLAAVSAIMALGGAFDGMTDFILSANGEEANMSGFMKLFGFELNDKGEFQSVNSEYNIWRGVGKGDGGFAMIVPALLAAVMWLVSMFLGLMMSLRTMLLVFLTAFAAIAIFGLSLDATKAWFSRWVAMIVGLLLAKPMAAAVLVMGLSTFRYAATTQQFVSGLVAVFIGAVMPLAAMSLLGFTAVQASNNAERSVTGAAAAPTRMAGRGVGAITRIVRR